MFFTQFGLLFSNMEWFVLVLFIIGVACMIVELLQPGFGVFGISGIALLVLAVILRAVFHKDGDAVLVQVFQFILLDVLLLGVLLLVLLIAQKKGWLKKTPFFHTGTAVGEERSDGTKDYAFLLGKEGVAATILRPSGKAEIEGALYDVESDGFLIEQGEKIKVTVVEGGVVKVAKIN